MNRTITSLLLIVLLMLLVISPFSALAMLMMVMFASAVIWLVSTIVQVIVKPEPPANEADPASEPNV